MHSSAPIKDAALREGFELSGICPAAEPPHLAAYLRWLAEGKHGTMDYMARTRSLRASPGSLLPGVRSILAVGLNYYREVSPQAPRVARYALGRDYHKVMKSKLRRVARWAEETYPCLRARPCVDSAPILERDFANLAGIGWFGKNTCLINTRRGSWFFIGLLLLDQEFEPDGPAEGGCGTCTKCLDACPTGALQFDSDRGIGVLDSTRCISYLTIEHKGPLEERQEELLSGWLFGCDVCQEVCPFNSPRPHQPLRSAEATEPDFAPRPGNAAPNLIALADISRDEFVRRYAGTAFMRAGAARIARTARALLRKGP